MNKILSIKRYSWESSPDMERDISEVIDDSNIRMNDEGQFSGTIKVTVEYTSDKKADEEFYLSEYRSGKAHRLGHCKFKNEFGPCSRPLNHKQEHAQIMRDDNSNLHLIAIWMDS